MPAPLPKKVKIGPLVYAINFVDNPQDGYDAHSFFTGPEETAPNTFLCGWGFDLTLRIQVCRRMAPLRQKQTLLHEVIHQCYRVAGYDPDEDRADDGGVEERGIRALDSVLFGVLRENPQLVAYLTER